MPGSSKVGRTRTNVVVRNAHLMSARDLSALLRKADSANCQVTLVSPVLDLQLLEITCASRQALCEVVHYGLTPHHLIASYGVAGLAETCVPGVCFGGCCVWALQQQYIAHVFPSTCRCRGNATVQWCTTCHRVCLGHAGVWLRGSVPGTEAAVWKYLSFHRRRCSGTCWTPVHARPPPPRRLPRNAPILAVSVPQLLALPSPDENAIQALAQSCTITTELEVGVVTPFLEFVLSTSAVQRNQVVWRDSLGNEAKYVAQCIVDYIASHPPSAQPDSVDPDFQAYCLANAALQFMSQ